MRVTAVITILTSLLLCRVIEGQTCRDLIKRTESLIENQHYDSATVIGRAALQIADSEAGQSDSVLAYVLHLLGECYLHQGNYSECRSAWEEALEKRQACLEPDHPDLALSLHSLGRVYGRQGKYDEAANLYMRALDIRRRVLGAEHPDFAYTLNNLAIIYRKQGRYSEAESLYVQALEIRKNSLGPSDPSVAQSLNNLAILYRKQGRYEQAEHFHRQALAIRREALGADDPEVAESLNNLGLLYLSQGRYAEAEPPLRESLDIRERVLGRDHPHVAQSLNNLALVQKEQGKYSQAESLLKEVLDIKTKALGSDHPDVLACRIGLGDLYRLQGKYADAESLYVQTLDIEKESLGPDHPDLVACLNGLGLLRHSQGSHLESERLHREALAIAEKVLGPDHPSVAMSLSDLAFLYREQGRYDEAEPLYKRALDIREKALGADHPYAATCLTGLGLLYQSQGRFAEAEAVHERALAVRKEALAPGHPDIAASLNCLAMLYKDWGDYARAEPLYIEAMEIRRAALGDAHPDVAMSMNNLGLLYWLQGRYDDAESLFKQALQIKRKALGECHPDVAMSLNNLGILYWQRGKLAQADSVHTQALEIRREVFGRSHPDVASSLNNLAILYSKQGRYAEAESLHKESLGIRTEVLGPDHPSVALALDNLAVLYLDQERYGEAETLFEKALDIRKNILGAEHPEVASCMEHMSELCRSQGRQLEALGYAKQAFEIRRKNFAENGIALSERDALRYSQFARRSLDNYLSCYFDVEEVDYSMSESAINVVLTSKGQVSDQIFWRQKALIEETDPYALRIVDSLRPVKYQLSRLFVRGPGDDIESHREDVDSLTELGRRLESELSRRSVSFKRRHEGEGINHALISSFLPQKSVLVEYLKYNRTQADCDSVVPYYIAVAISRDRPPIIVNLGTAACIDSLVHVYRRHMLRVSEFCKLLEEDQQEYREIASRLSEMVWKPISSYLDGEGKVLIAPDAALNMVSFAGLVEADGGYLVERLTIHYLSCGRDLVRLQSVDAPGVGLFALGDPDFEASASARLSQPVSVDGLAGEDGADAVRSARSNCPKMPGIVLNPLPGTRHEIEQVVSEWRRHRHEPVAVYFGEDASEERFKAEAPGNSVIHLATHGYFIGSESGANLEAGWPDSDMGYNGENPLLFSGVFLAGAALYDRNTECIAGEDGVLTAYEVSAMDLSGTELAVLSACETGLGEVETGEGVYGLRRAFQLAGARSVISALWKVPDRLTSKMMSMLYQRPGEHLAEKLRMVQLDSIKLLRDHGEPDHPVSWGGIVAVGDWR